MQEGQPLDLAKHPGPLELFVYALVAPLLLFEVFVFALAVVIPAGSLVEALGRQEWLSALAWTALLAFIVGVLVLVGRNQLQSKMNNPRYLFRRFFRSRLLAGDDSLDLGGGGEWRWSEIAGFEVRHDTRYAPRAGTWVEVSAVMYLKSGEEVELPALGCFHDRWRKHVQVVEQRVQRLNMLLQSAG